MGEFMYFVRQISVGDPARLSDAGPLFFTPRESDTWLFFIIYRNSRIYRSANISYCERKVKMQMPAFGANASKGRGYDDAIGFLEKKTHWRTEAVS
jgi:hypothetical protein